MYGPWFYAQEKGFFTKHDLETTLAFTDSGMKGVQALLGESIEICSCDSPSTVTAHLAGGDIKFIGATLSVLSGNVYAAQRHQVAGRAEGKEVGDQLVRERGAHGRATRHQVLRL